MIYGPAGLGASNFWPDLGLSPGQASNLEVGPGMEIPRPSPARHMYNPSFFFFLFLSFSGMREFLFCLFFCVKRMR